MKSRNAAPDPVSTTTLLREQYGPRVVIPLEKVMADYFPGLSQEHLLRRISEGKLNLPVVRIDESAKAARGVALADLAAYLDRRIEAARKECRQLCG